MDFVDEKIVSFNIRKPTENELQSLKIHWLCLKERNPFDTGRLCQNPGTRGRQTCMPTRDDHHEDT